MLKCQASPERVIEIQGLTRILKGRRVLDNIDLVVERGQIFGYLGPNGAGKTTTLRILLGLIQPTSGCASLFGRHAMQIDRESRAKIGVVLENHGLYDQLSAEQNLDYYGRIFGLSGPRRSARIETGLREADLWDRRRDKVGTLSKGMKQRLALARALLHDPELIFLDEPTAGLDPEGAHAIRELLLRLSREEHRTIFLTSHQLSAVERTCSHVAILDRGKVRVQGSVQRLVQEFGRPGVEITLKEGLTLGQVRSFIVSLPGVNGIRPINGRRFVIALKDPRSMKETLDALACQGFLPEEAKPIEPSLENVYLSIVGKEESDEE